MGLMNFLGSSVHVITTDDNILQGLLYQDAEMKSLFKAFPEVLYVDITYRTNDRQMTLCLLLVEDGNGESEIVGVWLLCDDTIDSDVIKNALSTFCTDNPDCSRVRYVMVDKDLVERETFSAVFPDAAIYMCFFHVLRTFRREVTTDKMSITTSQRDGCLEMLQQMVHASSEDSYMQVYIDFMAVAPTSVAEYFNHNWHGVREQWVRGLVSQQASLGNATNNRLDSISQKLKAVITPNGTFASCVTSLRTAIESLRVERDHRAITMVQKRAVCSHPASDPCYEYAQLLTPYALELISKQMSKMQLMQSADIVDEADGTWSIRSTSGVVTATADVCQCVFFTNIGLPCQHILAVRKASGLSLFAEDLCAVRWTRYYYQSSQRVFLTTSSTATSTTVSDTTHCSTLTQGEKRRQALMVRSVVYITL